MPGLRHGVLCGFRPVESVHSRAVGLELSVAACRAACKGLVGDSRVLARNSPPLLTLYC